MSTRRQQTKRRAHGAVTLHRSVRDVVYSALWPARGQYPDPKTSKRFAAIADVLTKIPSSAWKHLEELADKFRWLVPWPWQNGAVLRCPVTERDGMRGDLAVVLYLSPLLESQSSDFVVAVVAHELAHLSLDHRISIDGAAHEKHESEAWRLVRDWGFNREADIHREWSANRKQDSAPRTTQ